MERKSLYGMMLALTASMSITLSPALAQNPSNDVYQAVVKREFGTAGAEMQEIEKIIHNAKPADYPAIEKKLIGILEAPGATVAGRQFALRMLKFVASSKCVPAVSKLLQDKDLSHMARNVLQGLDGRKIEAALRDALEVTEGPVRKGIIETIGDRKDSSSLKTLAKMLKKADESTALSLLNAIGKIGGKRAADALDAYKPTDALKPDWSMAYLRCAEGVTAEGGVKRSLKMCTTLLEGAFPSSVRAGALRMIVLSQKDAAIPLVMKYLVSSDKLMKRAAMAMVLQAPGHAATLEFVRQLDVAPAPEKPLLISQLALRGDAEGVTGAINKLVTDPDDDVREAAIKALRHVGDASSVAVLAALLENATWGEPAKQALVNLQGKGVPEALIHQAESGDPATRIAVLNLLSDRKQASALPLARKAITDASADVRQAGLKIIARTGEQADLKLLCDSLLTTHDNAERGRLAGALAAVGNRVSDKATRCDAIVDTFGKGDASTKVLLIPVLSVLEGDKALTTVRAALAEAGDVHKAAVRVLAGWKDASPMADLRKVAKDEGDATLKIIALRGFIDMIGAATLTPAEKVQAYRDAMELATGPAEKNMILAGVAKIASLESLNVIATCLADGTLKGDAYLAYEEVAESLIGSQPAAAKEALQKVIDGTTDENLRKKAKDAIQKIKQ